MRTSWLAGGKANGTLFARPASAAPLYKRNHKGYNYTGRSSRPFQALLFFLSWS